MSRLEIRSFRLLIDDVVDRIRPHFRTLFPAICLPAMLAGALIALCQDRMMGLMVETDLEPQTAQFVGIVGAVLVAILTLALSLNALFVLSIDILAGRKPKLLRAWLFPLRPAVFLTLLLYSFLVFVSIVLFFVLFFVLALWVRPLLGLAILVFCFVLTIWSSPLLVMVIPVMVEEKKFGFAALSRSGSLVFHNPTRKLADSGFLQTLTLLVVGWMVQNAFGILVQGPFAIAQNYLVFRDGVDGTMDPQSMIAPLWLQLPAQVASAGLTAAAWFYWTFGIGMLYFEIRRRRESPDLRQAIGELTANKVGAGKIGAGEIGTGGRLDDAAD